MKYEYVVLEMSPKDSVAAMTDMLNNYGALGFRHVSTVVQADHVITTLMLEKPE